MKIEFSKKGKKGRSKDVEYIVEECGCWKCTSHTHRKLDNRVRITINGVKDYLYRFVYEEFKGEIPQGMLVRHLCGNSYCINPEHLAVGTHKDNMKDMANHGSQKGEKNPQNKYTIEQIEQVKNLIYEGELTTKEISEVTGVSRSTVLAVDDGYIWGWYNISKSKNKSMKRMKYGKKKRDEIKADISKGFTYREIQKKHNVSAGFIHSLKSEMDEVSE
jgi:predicted XRE-type DNA-binding protein